MIVDYYNYVSNYDFSDVLAVLLKSPIFEEILIPPQRRLNDIAPPNPGNNYRSAEPDIIRGTQPASGASNHLNSHKVDQANSSLSPYAKEFVPSGLQPTPAMTSQQESNDLAYAMSQVQVQGQNDSFQGLMEELDGSDCILSTVTDMISQVSQDPASLNRCSKVTVDVLKKHLHNDETTLGIVVTLLVEQVSNS